MKILLYYLFLDFLCRNKIMISFRLILGSFF